MLDHEQRIELLVPQLVLDEFRRNRARVATDMTRLWDHLQYARLAALWRGRC